MTHSLSERPTADVSSGFNAGKSRQAKKARYFFVVMSFLFLGIALGGFLPSYNRISEFPIHWSAHIHGAIMTSWLLVFITQTVLASGSRLKLHRQLGLSSVALGALVWISMAIASMRALWGYNPPVDHFLFDVLIMEFHGMLMFGTFFTWGILARKDGNAHKRLMFFSTLILIQAAIDRMYWLPGIGSALFVRFVYLDVFLLALVAYDLTVLKYVHRVTWLGCLIIVATQSGITMLWGLPIWHKFWFDIVNSFR